MAQIEKEKQKEDEKNDGKKSLFVIHSTLSSFSFRASVLQLCVVFSSAAMYIILFKEVTKNINSLFIHTTKYKYGRQGCNES